MQKFLPLVLSFFLSGINAGDQDWTPVVRDKRIYYDLESVPLQIKTDSRIGSDDLLAVMFYSTQGDYAGGFWAYFSTSPQYDLPYCMPARAPFYRTPLPSATNKVWRITVTRTSGTRLVVHCNEVEVLDILLSSKCSSVGWSRTWNRDIAKIEFPYYDTAADYYMPHPVKCTGLKTAWDNLEADTEFPVTVGTVVTLSCKEGRQLSGDKDVTCTKDTEFDYSTEPRCEACTAGSFRSGNLTTCEMCEGNTISSEGASFCTACDIGEVANHEKTGCAVVKCVQGDGKAAAKDCANEDAGATECSGPKFTEYTGIAAGEYKCGPCADNAAATCEKCTGKADAACNAVKELGDDFKCKDWEYKEDKFVLKTAATTCKRLKATATKCNMPGAKAKKTYAVKNAGCGPCTADDKKNGLCDDCDKDECNVPAKPSSAATITAFVLPLIATLYALL